LLRLDSTIAEDASFLQAKNRQMLTKFYDCAPRYGGNKHTSDIRAEDQQISGLVFRLTFRKEPGVSKT